MQDTLEADVRRAAEAIREADALLIGAGAGIGVDSGLPDFRGDEGFWKAYPPFRKLNLSFVDLANPMWFSSDPALAWGFYGHRLNLYRETTPHAGFETIRNWGASKRNSFFVFTSNVDGQFQKAGFPEARILERHGSIYYLQCAAPCSRDLWPAEDVTVNVHPETFRAQRPLPACPRCGGMARPNILMFGDFGWIADREEEQQRQYASWLRKLGGAKLAILECGAGTAVPTVRHECERRQGLLIRINPREPVAPKPAVELPMGTLEAVSRIAEMMG